MAKRHFGNIVGLVGALGALVATSWALVCCSSDPSSDAVPENAVDAAVVETSVDAAVEPPVDAAVDSPREVQRLVILPLGDSITEGLRTTTASGYRAELWNRMLGLSGYSFDFVGSLRSGQLPDGDHEGHSGWRIDQLTAKIDGWLATYKPNIVLLHIGTNDMAKDYELATAPDRLGTLIDKIAADVPGVTIVVAQIVPTKDATISKRVEAFNSAIPAMVQSKVSQGKKVRVVDMYHALGNADLSDTLHPNESGYSKMASVWYSDLERILAEDGRK
ncbi:SGNH/GDSL hydrolase family protein [Pendulispora rubella]|uniref:SGNH/GDSL hydrolase family protein n=1 Tax=Pendulispora rubella TaxID=2741070 RepID=A0ABZ2L4Z8_9BACT